MNTSTILSSSILLDIESLKLSKSKSDEVIKKVIPKLKEFDATFLELGVEGEDKSIAKFFLTKLLITSPDLDIEEVRTFLLSFKVPEIDELPALDIQVASLMRATFVMDRFLMLMLLTGQISESNHANLKKEIEKEMIIFLGDITDIYHKISEKLSKFIFLNLAETLISKNFEQVVVAISSTQDITERFTEAPSEILDPLFRETLKNIRVSLYTASDLLGQ